MAPCQHAHWLLRDGFGYWDVTSDAIKNADTGGCWIEFASDNFELYPDQVPLWSCIPNGMNWTPDNAIKVSGRASSTEPDPRVDNISSTLAFRGMDNLIGDGNKTTVTDDGATVMKKLNAGRWIMFGTYLGHRIVFGAANCLFRMLWILLAPMTRNLNYGWIASLLLVGLSIRLCCISSRAEIRNALFLFRVSIS